MAEFKGQPRLPKFALPKRYDIKLKPDLDSCKFSGSVSIDTDIVAETRFIVLNAADLTVDSGSVSFTDSKSSKVSLNSSSPILVFILIGVRCLGFNWEELGFSIVDFDDLSLYY